MLLTKSFDISDSDGVNELLTTYRLASGAHILVSDGKILIPYEDGTPPNKAQRIVAIREDQNKLRIELGIVEHSNRVMGHLIADAQDRVNVARAEVESATANPVRKELEKKLATAEGALNEATNQKLMNEHEISRLNVNLDLFDEQVKKIEAE